MWFYFHEAFLAHELVHWRLSGCDQIFSIVYRMHFLDYLFWILLNWCKKCHENQNFCLRIQTHLFHQPILRLAPLMLTACSSDAGRPDARMFPHAEFTHNPPFCVTVQRSLIKQPLDLTYRVRYCYLYICACESGNAAGWWLGAHVHSQVQFG